jgi:hypothetical protein
MYKGKIFYKKIFEKLAFYCLDIGAGTGTVTCKKSEPEP